MVGDSVSQCGFSVVYFHKYKHFFSFCNFKNEEFHTFAPSYGLTKQKLDVLSHFVAYMIITYLLNFKF